MQVQKIQNNNYSNYNKPVLGNRVFKPMNADFIKAIEKNPSFNKLSKELETLGMDLIFSTASCCDAYTVHMSTGEGSKNIYLAQIAGSLPANCEKMVKQLETYSCDTILEAINLGKRLFNK